MAGEIHDKGQKTSGTVQHLPQAGNPPIGTVTSSFFVSMDEVFSTSTVGNGSSANAAALASSVQLLWYTSR